MPITICWVEKEEQEDKTESNFTVGTCAGKLVVYQTGDVISRTTWLDVPLINNKNLKNTKIQQYINNPAKYNLTVNLQKQGSVFRNKVWVEICRIPAGEVLSYSEIANKISSGARAVANACRDNPFPGIIPCHRVVSVSGLGGYMGETSGELFEIKKKLLAIEKADLMIKNY
ncbi:MAG: MGMT family protein [Methylococcales bacterium]|nr:MGMT family protein [Methylococcales bacterium]